MAEAPPSLSLEDIVSRHGLRREDLECVCPQYVRISVAVKLVDWEMVGYCFSFPREKIAAIDRENDTEDQRKVALLNAWSEREGDRATFLRLAAVLHQRKRNDLVDLLCKAIIKREAPISKAENDLGGLSNFESLTQSHYIKYHSSCITGRNQCM